jgi:hypothetical protein
MRIEPDLLSDRLRAAAVEQTARRLSREGHEVQKDARLGGSVVADLRAVMPGGREKLYYFVLAGMGTAGRPERASEIRTEASARGAEYHLVLVRPPRDVEVEIVGIEDALKQALIDSPPENLYDLAPVWEIIEVTDVQVARARLFRGENRVVGEGLVTIEAPTHDIDAPYMPDVYPLKFDTVLDAQGALRSVKSLEVDTSA